LVLSICTGMDLLDKAFIDNGFNILPGCETDPGQRLLYRQLCGKEPITYDIRELINWLKKSSRRFNGVIGGPPCQAFTKLKAVRKPKFPDLTPEVRDVLELVKPEWYLLENVVRIDIPGAKHVRLDAMHFAKPHQSRPRWFTYSPNLQPPPPAYSGNANTFVAYPGVYGKLYGTKRAAILQGYPAVADLKAPSPALLKGIANAVHYEVAKAWAKAIRANVNNVTQ